MTNIYAWSNTAASNSNADSGINWSENQAASTVNDSARVMMKRVADWLDDLGGTTTTGGTGNAQTLTVLNGFAAYSDGIVVGFTAGNSNTAAATLNVNSIGAKSIYANAAVLTGGEIVAGAVYVVAYDPLLNASAGGWHLLNPKTTTFNLTAAGTIVVTDNVNAALRVTQLGTGNTVLFEDSANPDSTPWLIDGSGNRVQGHTAAITTILPYDATAATASWQMHGLTKPTTLMGLNFWGANADCGTYTFSKSRGAAVGTYTVVNSGDNLGAIVWEGADGVDFAQAAQIRAEVDGTPGSNDMPGRIKLLTSIDGAQSPQVAVTVDSSQNTTFAGKALTPASTTTKAGLNIGAAGTAPTSPVDGDVWRISGKYQSYDGTGTRTIASANTWTFADLTLAQGDTLYATGAGAVTNLAKGTAFQVLTMNSGATAPSWSAQGFTLISTNTLSGGATLDITSLDNYVELLLYFDNVKTSAAGSELLVRVSSDAGGTYAATGYFTGRSRIVNAGATATNVDPAYNGMSVGTTGAAVNGLYGTARITGLNLATVGTSMDATSADATASVMSHTTNRYLTVRTDNAIRILWASGNLNSGTIYVLGRRY